MTTIQCRQTILMAGENTISNIELAQVALAPHSRNAASIFNPK
jgi:hypothetical protein